MLCSVLVEELGSWKAALLRWTAEAAEALQALLDEQALLRCHARRGYRFCLYDLFLYKLVI
jgi:hypothetical protein